MQSKDLLLLANQQAYFLTMPLMEDMQTAPLVPPMPGGNHAHWVVGHLLFSEGRFQQIMKGGENQFEEMQVNFGGGSIPEPQGKGFRMYHDLLSEVMSQHQSVMTLLETLSEDDLDQPCQSCPPGFEPFFGTWRQVFLMRAMHWMIHRGQLADCRRAAGREPMLA
ncbi:MAG: DinB family protein [Planctomyces sp.]|nr:DinB family protein [Planctomyces sp.]